MSARLEESPSRRTCRPGPSASATGALVVVSRVDSAAAIECQQSMLAPALDEAAKRHVHRLALGLHVGELHDLLHELVIQDNVGSHIHLLMCIETVAWPTSCADTT